MLTVVLVAECVLVVVAVIVTSVRLAGSRSAPRQSRLQAEHAISAAGLAPGLPPQRITAALPTLERSAEAS